LTTSLFDYCVVLYQLHRLCSIGHVGMIVGVSVCGINNLLHIYNKSNLYAWLCLMHTGPYVHFSISK
jgi:hypothetical protein